MSGRVIPAKQDTIITAGAGGAATISSGSIQSYFKKARVWLNNIGQPSVEALIVDIDVPASTLYIRILTGNPNPEYGYSNISAYAGGLIFQNEQIWYDAPQLVTLTNGSTGGGGGGDASEATLVQVRDSVKAQIGIAATLWTDDSGAYYTRRELVNQGTGAITIVWVNAAGATVTPGVGLRPATGSGGSSGGLTDAELRATPVPVSVSSLPLPASASTLAEQQAQTTKLTAIDNKIPVVGQSNMAGSLPVVIASNQSVLSIQASSLPLPLGAATEATLASILTNTAALDAPISGLATQATLANINSKITACNTGAVVITSSALPTGAATSALQTTGNTTLSSIDTRLSNPLTVTGPLTDAQLRATAVPVSAASLPLPTGAATESTLATRLSEAGFQARINTLGQKTMANSTPVVISSDQSSLPVTASSLPLPSGAASAANQTTIGAQTTKINDGTNTAAVTAANALKVDGSAVTQPVSGTVAVSNLSTLSTLAEQRIQTTALSTANASLASIDTKTPSLGQAIANTSVPVVLASDQSAVPVSFSVASTLQTSDESTPWLRRIAKLSESLSVVDSAQRQRISLDSIAAGVTLPTVTGVTTVSSVTNVAAQGSMAGMDREMYINIARQTYAMCIRAKIT